MPATRKSPSPVGRRHRLHVSREMRRLPTPAEDALWQKLRNRQIADAKFRRQRQKLRFCLAERSAFCTYVDRTIVDFYCAEAQLVIEIDGTAHDAPNYDAERQAHLETLGLRVLRFPNADVLDRMEDALDTIRAALTTSSESAEAPPSD
jgi:very-short-patch-repair endonuclease